MNNIKLFTVAALMLTSILGGTVLAAETGKANETLTDRIAGNHLFWGMVLDADELEGKDLPEGGLPTYWDNLPVEKRIAGMAKYFSFMKDAKEKGSVFSALPFQTKVGLMSESLRAAGTNLGEMAAEEFSTWALAKHWGYTAEKEAQQKAYDASLDAALKRFDETNKKLGITPRHNDAEYEAEWQKLMEQIEQLK